MSAAYAPPAAAPESALPAAPDGTAAASETLARAVEHGDEHVVKFADTAVDTFERTADPAALSAAIRATRLIEPAG